MAAMVHEFLRRGIKTFKVTREFQKDEPSFSIATYHDPLTDSTVVKLSSNVEYEIEDADYEIINEATALPQSPKQLPPNVDTD